MPHLVIYMLINRPVGLGRSSATEVCSPASQDLVQPSAHVSPRPYVTRHQKVAHLLLDPSHALFRRTVADIPLPRSQTVVRPECIPQKIESLHTGVPNTRLLFVHGQLQPLQHSTRPLQRCCRFSTTENHKVVR